MESDEGLQKHLSNLLQFGFSIITGVFHVVEHDGEGGETLLVDGFYAAEQLRQKDSKAYEFLTKKVVAHEYNPCDRSPLFTLSAEDTRLFYNYYGKLTQEVQNKDNEFWVKLKPDMVLFVDNWRVMHGRSAFTGRRYVSGCYLNRDDWISRARDFGLLFIDSIQIKTPIQNEKSRWHFRQTSVTMQDFLENILHKIPYPVYNLSTKIEIIKKIFRYDKKIYSTIKLEGSRAQDIEKQENGIILNYGKYNLNLLYIWLRDHCRCDVCYNKKTNQKNVDNYTLSSDIKPEHIDYNGQDGHFTCYSLDWLLENTFHPFHQDRVTKKLWNSHTLKDEALPTVEYKHYMESDEGLQKHLSNLLQFGFSIITGVFHVVEHDGEGGETLLVDGFYAAEQLRQKDAKAYEFLAKKVVAHEYNPCDRSPLFTLSAEDTRLFYNYYGKLTQEVQNKDNEFWVKLKPDMVLFVDNWRVMHGRSAFTGRRYVSGCYLNRDDWISRARDFGLLSL
ncbi:hypothetical protein KUTeg_012641 [Tegillarca granosa]|uniref:trimethyllysine dioxygenase n=1 Tax=Tegillarca granosa TaxID=220873 RepID=A0ABQ9F048_TEGGR|nr:hypothetical protein KUTeg_012641 [Tegillarca granosa]